MKQYCPFFTAAFDKVLEVHQEAATEDLAQSAYLGLKKPPCNTLREANCNNSDDELLAYE